MHSENRISTVARFLRVLFSVVILAGLALVPGTAGPVRAASDAGGVGSAAFVGDGGALAWDGAGGATAGQIPTASSGRAWASITATGVITDSEPSSLLTPTPPIIPIGPVADFAGSPTSGVVPLTVTFINRSMKYSPDSCWWDFGDGATSTKTDPTHRYSTPGIYTVTLQVSDFEGTTDTAIKKNYITVSSTSAGADFVAAPTSGVAPLSVAFTNTSSGNYTTYSWDFGDGGTSTQTNPTHIYTAPGAYTVSLTASGPEGSDTETKTSFINVTSLISLQADFIGSPTNGTATLTVDFTNTSTGEYTSSLWDFGNGTTSSKQNPTCRYRSPGLYTVSLTVTGPSGSDTETKVDYIRVCASPQAGFSATPTSGVAPLSVAFTNSSCGAFSSFSWSFGDGGTSTAANPTHVYSSGGVYTVSLTASGADGTVTETKAAYISVYAPPTAGFAATPTAGDAPLAVAFSNTSTGDFTTSEWDFGDGGTSTQANPTHTYTTPGVYTVALTVDGLGGTDTETKAGYISVSAPVQADFSAAPTTGIAPLTVSFSDASTGDYDSLSWDFGDGSPPSSEANPTHTYTAGGVYTVTLTASGLYGSDTEAKPGYVTVYTPVVAGLAAAPLGGPAPLTVEFSNTSTGDYSTSLWDFGDTVTSMLENPVHTYTTPGVYTVALTVDGPGGSGTLVEADYITVYEPSQAGFAAEPISGTLPLAVTFTNTSTGDYTDSLWDFGDTVTSTLESPAHTYTAAGVYTVTLTVDGPGGSDSVSHEVSVYEPSVAGFSAEPQSGVAPLAVTFSNTSTGDYSTSLWDFGDTITSTLESPVHTYTTPGVYTVTLTVDGPGGTDTVVEADYITVYEPSQAGFAAEPISGTLPLAVTFTNTSTGDYTDSLWDFGDTITSTLESPVHTYTAAGVYTVTLSIDGPGGADTWTAPECVSVYTPAVAAFEAEPSAGVVPHVVTFTNTSTGDYAESLWDFGDTMTSTLESPTHFYNAPGLYTVSLTVSGLGGTDTKVITDCIDVYPLLPSPGDADTDLVVQNLGPQDALMAAALTTAGTGDLAWSTDLPPIASRASHLLPSAEFGGEAAGAWAGAGDVASSEPLAAVVNVRWDAAGASYAGVALPGTTAYLPLLITTPGHKSDVTIQNGEGAEAAVAVRFYDRAGTLSGTKALTVPAGSEVMLALSQVPEADFSATGGLGSAVITADHAIAAVASVHWPHASDAYSSVAGGAATLLAPGTVRTLNADGRYDWSELAVQNPGEAAASVHVELIAADGTLSHALEDTIPAHGGASYSTRELAALGEDWQGTIVVTSDQPLVGVSVSWLPTAGVADNLAYNAGAAVAQPLAFPDVHRELAGAEGDAWSLVLVHNATGSAGMLSVEFYDAAGKVGETYSVAVPAQGLARLSLQDGLDLPQAALDVLGTDFSGSMWVTPSAGMEIAGVAETLWPGEAPGEQGPTGGRAAGYAGMAAP